MAPSVCGLGAPQRDAARRLELEWAAGAQCAHALARRLFSHHAARMEDGAAAPARRIVAEQLMLGRKARRIAPPPSPPHVPREWDSDGVSSGVHSQHVTDTKSCFTM